tara:strand:- start:707 stop:1024 length:318 start_codon:yes stop_codon:yes gene_type:complete
VYGNGNLNKNSQFGGTNNVRKLTKTQQNELDNLAVSLSAIRLLNAWVFNTSVEGDYEKALQKIIAKVYTSHSMTHSEFINLCDKANQIVSKGRSAFETELSKSIT